MNKAPTQTQITRRATAAAAREAVLDSGGKALYVLLDADHTAMLQRLMDRMQSSAKDVICACLRSADACDNAAQAARELAACFPQRRHSRRK